MTGPGALSHLVESTMVVCNGSDMQRTLIPPNTWFCPIWDLHIMFKPLL